MLIASNGNLVTSYLDNTFKDHNGYFSNMIIAPNGNLVSSSIFGEINIRNYETGELIHLKSNTFQSLT